MSRASKGARIAAASLAAVGTAGAGAQQANLWNPWAWVIWSCIAAPGVVAVGEQIRVIRAEGRAVSDGERQEAIERTLTDAVLKVSDLTGYDKWSVGVSAWRVVPGNARKAEHLVRFGHRRLSDRPQPSNITWTRGKGIIGQCWEKEAEVHRDLRPACQRYSDGQISESRFNNVSQGLKMGMDLAEFRMMIGKYGEVLAVPIKDRMGKFLGCLTVDIPIEQCVDPTVQPARLSKVEVKEVAAANAAILGRMLKTA